MVETRCETREYLVTFVEGVPLVIRIEPRQRTQSNRRQERAPRRGLCETPQKTTSVDPGMSPDSAGERTDGDPRCRKLKMGALSTICFLSSHVEQLVGEIEGARIRLDPPRSGVGRCLETESQLCAKAEMIG